MKNYLVSIQHFEDNCIGIAKGNNAYEAVYNFVKECITIENNVNIKQETTHVITYASGYSLPRFAFVEKENISIDELTKNYIRTNAGEIGMSAYEIPENFGNALVAIDQYDRDNQKLTVGTNGEIL